MLHMPTFYPKATQTTILIDFSTGFQTDLYGLVIPVCQRHAWVILLLDALKIAPRSNLMF
jgi:hypothetical protein